MPISGRFAPILSQQVVTKIIAFINDKDGGSVDPDLYGKERIRILTLVSELQKEGAASMFTLHCSRLAND